LALEATTDKELSNKLDALASDSKYFMTGLPIVRQPDPALGSQMLRDLLKEHNPPHNLDTTVQRYKIVVCAFSR
jgi:hypothetical protein